MLTQLKLITNFIQYYKIFFDIIASEGHYRMKEGVLYLPQAAEFRRKIYPKFH